MEIVKIVQNQAFADSRVVAENFGKAHRDVLRAIETLLQNLNEADAQNCAALFKRKEWMNELNRKYPYYEMGRDGFSLLVMGFTGKEALKWKLKYIEAFNLMEKTLLNKDNGEWITTREQGKQIRKAETDIIKAFTEYAIQQGSEGAKFYYKHYTNATYKALQLMEHKKPKTRDTLDLLQLHQLILAEDVVTRTIKKEMEAGEHYKVIFEKCKVSLENFARGLMLIK